MKPLQEMMSIDQERALTTAIVWAEFLQKAAGREHSSAFERLEDYIPYRAMDCGEMLWFRMMICGSS